ncbi:hypothetical protein CMQ_7986 [Grosmannia clavigera kw1407]|uniref:DUF7707 domain-containing protein n=1 Tax=Grosmannia clavigera (strain kw1407 / UAMH 11150) TaxID=655863 RepID=F0XRR9_GROCL|nr:uncharacterized protein CMQ_7986 [Grosmannia clavigera kw1407]EFW99618.1 hypothetical protein CMQ_7986 [Grosmannia clavigera kw1407]
MRNTILIAASAVGLAVATTNFTIDPNSVQLSTRSSWCAGQENTCTTLCSDSPTANSCDPNKSAPGLQYYLQTMPTYICNEAYAECVSENPNNATGQSACKSDIQDNCGTLDPSKADLSSGTTTSAAAASTTASTTGSNSATAATTASASAVTTASSKAGAMPTNMAHYGSGVAAVAVGLFAYVL